MFSLCSAIRVLIISGLLFNEVTSKVAESRGLHSADLVQDQVVQGSKPFQTIDQAGSVGDVLKGGDSKPNAGTRLILTELLEAGNITGARALAQVRGGPFPAHITSYSGFFTVDRRFNSNLFFWFFPAETNHKNAPVMLFLHGGPGESSMLGLFNEIGPFSIDVKDPEILIENPYSWHKNHSLIFIDNPVGTGFSFTEDPTGYSRNQTEIGNSLHSALDQFFTMFPELRNNEFFIAGESYAGKYVPALGYTIHSKNPFSERKINLKGILVGNGFTDPICMMEASELAFQLGLVDTSVKEEMARLEEQAKAAILTEDFEAALLNRRQTVEVFANNSNFTYAGNILQTTWPPFFREYETFLQRPAVRARIHVGSGNYSSLLLGGTALDSFLALTGEFMVSAKPYLETLLEHYRVLYYSGQLDTIVSYPMSVCMYRSLQWSAADKYSRAERHSWYVGKDLAGYMKSAGKFTEVLVRNAGHMVPMDQPAWAFDLVTRFTSHNFGHQQSGE